jgi:hypothetical protein
MPFCLFLVDTFLDFTAPANHPCLRSPGCPSSNRSMAIYLNGHRHENGLAQGRKMKAKAARGWDS